MKLTFMLPENSGVTPLHITVEQLVIAGWTGRNPEAIQHHINELAALGVPPPSAVPLFYRVASNQLTQEANIEVVGKATSGEAEPFIFTWQNELFVSLASDHTDRDLEAHSVALSKQICVKPVARQAWRITEVAEHWDELILRSWIREEGKFRLYQEGHLSSLRRPGDLLERYLAGQPLPANGLAMTCGTVAAIGGVRPASEFRMELVDEKSGRTITHSYQSVELPVIA